MKKLIIHVGTEKTGTTAIQHFCAKNRSLLKEQGLIYPVVGFCDFAHFSLVAPFHAIDNNGRALEFAPPGDYLVEVEWARIKEIFSGNKNVSVLISAEHFSSRLKYDGINALKRAVEWLGDDIAVQIVMFVRRQDKYLQSWYSTHVKAGGTLTFDQAFDQKKLDPWFFDYNFVANAWANAFGNDSISIGVFERNQMQGGLYSAFSGLVGIELNDSFDFDVPDDNNSWPVSFLEFARLVNEQSKGRLFKQRYRVLDELSKLFFDRGGSLLSPSRARYILDSFGASNSLLARNYLGREDGCLFCEIEPQGGEDWSKPDSLSTEELSRMLVDYFCIEKSANA